MDAQRLRHQSPHPLAGLQGPGGILEHRLELPPQRPQGLGGQGGQVLPVKEDLAFGGGQQAQQQPGQGGFPAAGFPHQGQSLPLVQAQVMQVYASSWQPSWALVP